MGKISISFGKWSYFLIAVIAAFSFAVFSKPAHAADATEFVFFRIDSELNTLIANKGTLTLRWSCASGLSGLVQDGTASESTGVVTADGIIKVASVSKEMTDAGCNFTGTKTITASASIDGWITRRWTQVIPVSTSYSGAFATGASMDYDLVVNSANDELGNAFTMASTSNATNTFASASYSGTLASSSYHAGKWFAAATGDGTLNGGKDGYANKTQSVTWSADYQTTSKSADFDGTAGNATYDGGALLFGHKIGVYLHGSTFASNPITSGTVTAGDSLAINCTNGGSGYWYCPVPLSHTGVIGNFDGTNTNWYSNSVTYTDRTSGADAQVVSYITVDNRPVSGGSAVSSGGGNNTPTPTPTPTSSPTPMPTVTPTPTPTPSASVKLYRKVSDPKVYVLWPDGSLTWVRTLADFNAAGYQWSDVQVISGPQFAKLGVKSTLGVKHGVKWLNVRQGGSLKSAIIGRMMPSDTFEKTGQSGVWYKINFNGKDGWVHSGYTVEK